MRIRTIILALCFLPLSTIGQELLDVALRDKSPIVINEPYIIKLEEDPFYIKRYLDYLNHSSVVVKDTSLIRSLVKLSKVQDTTKWRAEEFLKRIVINNDDFINTKKTTRQLASLNKYKLKEFKKEIRKYNNRSNDWRSFPIRVSRPIYSDDCKFVIVGVIRGNEGSEISLFKSSRSSWIHLGYLERKAY